MDPSLRRPALVAVALLLCHAGRAAAQAALPIGELFRPLLADPKQPRFSASYLWARSPSRDTHAGSTAFGASIGIVRWAGTAEGDGVQLGLAGGVFAQFDMLAPSMDLMNADYVIGVPLSFSAYGLTGRVRLYHQSSHLGDEFLLRTQSQRINLSFEALEVLFSGGLGPWRIYGGGEYLLRHEPGDLRPGLVHGGLEYRREGPVARIGQMASARLVMGVDARLWQQHDWSPGLSGKAGLEFFPGDPQRSSERSWSILVEGYSGPSPYGQFFSEDITSFGFGLYFWL
jgi:hypothetical protein